MSIRIGDKIIASVSNKDTANKDLSNITILGQQVINNPYPRFCVNSGSIDEEGNPNFIEINDLTITAKAPFVFTTTRGKTIQVNTDITETLSESFSGEIFLKPTNDSVSFVFGGEYFIQKSEPENPIENYTIWVDTSIFPEISYLYTVNGWEETDLVPIGTVTIGEVEEPTEPTEPEEEPTEPILPEEGPIEVTPATISASDYASLTSYDETALYVLSDSGNEVDTTTSLTEENYEQSAKDVNTLYVVSNNDTTINNTVALTQEEYDALEVKNENTLYMITEEQGGGNA